MTASLSRLVWSPSAILWCLSSLGDNTPRIMHTTGGINHAETDRPATPILTQSGATKKVTGGDLLASFTPCCKPCLSLTPWPLDAHWRSARDTGLARRARQRQSPRFWRDDVGTSTTTRWKSVPTQERKQRPTSAWGRPKAPWMAARLLRRVTRGAVVPLLAIPGWLFSDGINNGQVPRRRRVCLHRVRSCG